LALTPPPYQPSLLLVPSSPVLLERGIGRLFSGLGSRLDAFSGYPDTAWLPGVCLARQPVN